MRPTPVPHSRCAVTPMVLEMDNTCCVKCPHVDFPWCCVMRLAMMWPVCRNRDIPDGGTAAADPPWLPHSALSGWMRENRHARKRWRLRRIHVTEHRHLGRRPLEADVRPTRNICHDGRYIETRNVDLQPGEKRTAQLLEHPQGNAAQPFEGVVMRHTGHGIDLLALRSGRRPSRAERNRHAHDGSRAPGTAPGQ